jgi:hypothetical protein
MSTNTEQQQTPAALPAKRYTDEELLDWVNNHVHPEEQRRRKATSLYNPSNPPTPSTYGPAYNIEIDGERVQTQLEKLASFMDYCRSIGAWVSLAEIEEQTGIPQSSASAQLRHLRKPQFGNNTVEKRRRSANDGGRGGTWEYMVKAKRYDTEGL